MKIYPQTISIQVHIPVANVLHGTSHIKTFSAVRKRNRGDDILALVRDGTNEVVDLVGRDYSPNLRLCSPVQNGIREV